MLNVINTHMSALTSSKHSIGEEGKLLGLISGIEGVANSVLCSRSQGTVADDVTGTTRHGIITDGCCHGDPPSGSSGSLERWEGQGHNLLVNKLHHLM